MTPRSLTRIALACGGVLAAAAHATALAAQTTVSTAAGAVDTSFSGGVITYGQTFTAPDAIDRRLTTFQAAIGFFPQTFVARLAVWDTTAHRMGTVLWTGTDVTPLRTAYRTFTVGQVLDPGTTYVFALSVGSGGIPVGTFARFDNPYAGGGAVFFDGNTGTLGELQSAAWSGPSATEDLGFTAQFQSAAVTATPEPSTWALLGAGLLTVSAVTARRRTRAAS